MASSSMCASPRVDARERASVVFPEPEQPTTAMRSMSAFLFGRSDQDLVDGDAAGLRHGVADALRDVLRLHDLNAAEGLRHALQDFGPVVRSQFGGRGPWFD